MLRIVDFRTKYLLESIIKIDGIIYAVHNGGLCRVGTSVCTNAKKLDLERFNNQDIRRALDE